MEFVFVIVSISFFFFGFLYVLKSSENANKKVLH